MPKPQTIAPKITIGIVLYGTKYLTESLPSLLAQSFREFELLLIDQEENLWSATKLIESKLPELQKDPRVKIFQGQNRWHSGGQNFLIRKSKAPLYIVASNDMFYPENFLQQVWQTAKQQKQISIFAPKIWYWDFPHKVKTRILDSTGLIITRKQKILDRGQGEFDQGQYDKQSEIFGANGACAIFRKTILEKIRFRAEFFDELLHYKNDCELAYRLCWAGAKALFAPAITCWHDRQFPENSFRERFQIPRALRLNSFFGHRVLLLKNFSPKFSWRIKFAKSFYELQKILWLICCEPFLLKAFWQIQKQKRALKEKKSKMIRAITASQMEKFFG